MQTGLNDLFGGVQAAQVCPAAAAVREMSSWYLTVLTKHSHKHQNIHNKSFKNPSGKKVP